VICGSNRSVAEIQVSLDIL